MTEPVTCPISGSPMERVFSETVLGKYQVSYYYSPASGLLRTEAPYWLDEAYREAIGDADTGLVARNIRNSQLLEVLLACLSLDKGKVVDVAGGYGLLTRLMRDKGFDCYTTDKYCQNLFARTFEPGTDFQADALCAFEVLEHLENPLQFLQTVFTQYRCKTLIFSTLTFAGAIPARDWWYYAFEEGQHITFYQPRTLALLAARLGCNYYRVNPGVHVITDIKIPSIGRLILRNRYLRKAYTLAVRHRRRKLSRTWDDHLQIRSLDKTD